MGDYHEAARAADFHRLLLRMAGYMPDGVIAGARLWLADGRLADVARAVSVVAAERRIPLPDEDFALLSATAPDDEASLTALAAVDPNTALWPALPYTFRPAQPDAAMFSGRVPPLLDLTAGPAALRDAVIDDVDRAAMRALGRVASPIALWRAWRLAAPGTYVAPLSRIYMLEADAPGVDLPAVAARMQQALTAAGLTAPQVEVYPPGMDLPTYQRLVRGAAALLWTASTGAPVEIARVFDGVSAVTGPWFDEAHEWLDSDEREQVARFLEAGPPVLVTTQRMADIVEPARGQVVPMSYRTDGRWVWTDTVTYYLRTYGLAPDRDLLAHIRGSNFRIPEVNAVAEYRALAALYRPTDAEPVWTA